MITSYLGQKGPQHGSFVKDERHMEKVVKISEPSGVVAFPNFIRAHEHTSSYSVDKSF